MSEKLRSINTKFWEDPWIEKLLPKDKLLFLYLLTNTKTNMLGIYEISLSKISFETGLKNDEILKAFKGFERVSKAFYKNNFVIMTNFLKNQKMNPNMKKSAMSEFEKLPDWIKSNILGNGSKGFESLTKGFQMVRKIEVEDEDEIEGEDEDPVPVPKPKKEKFGDSVLLEKIEYEKLIEQFGKNQTDWMVDKLDNFKISKGKKYNSDYRAILSWVVAAAEEEKKKRGSKLYGHLQKANGPGGLVL